MVSWGVLIGCGVVMGAITQRLFVNRKYLKESVGDFNKLRREIARANPNDSSLKVWKKACETVLQAKLFKFLYNYSVRKVDAHTWEFFFVFKQKVYKIMFKTTRGPSKTLSITDENGHSRLEDVTPYMGPSEDFFKGIMYTPSYFEAKSLTFIGYYDKKDPCKLVSKTFHKDDPLTFQKKLLISGSSLVSQEGWSYWEVTPDVYIGHQLV